MLRLDTAHDAENLLVLARGDRFPRFLRWIERKRAETLERMADPSKCATTQQLQMQQGYALALFDLIQAADTKELEQAMINFSASDRNHTGQVP